MSDKKPFFYRIDAAEFLAAVVTVPEEKRADWVLRLALDLVSATHSGDFSQKLIAEARNYKEAKKNAGRNGGLARASRAKAKSSTAKICLSTAQAESSRPQASNRESKDYKEDNIKRTVFKPPTFAEVSAYCKERKNGIDPSKWMNHYSAKGWMVGKNKMVDWKAAVRTWEKTEAPAETEEEHNRRRFLEGF